MADGGASAAGNLTAGREGKHLTFILAEEEYGIGILKVKKILGMLPITLVPQTPGSIKGGVNLRGKVIPVIDLRLRFGMPTAGYSERTCIIVVELVGQAATVQIGIAVDAESELLTIKSEEIAPTPAVGSELNTDYILGMVKTGGGIKILLDIDRMLGGVGSALMAAAV
jgi:purine-binding chemotaxis protein CheW